ncbi:sensor histidine kinase [Halomonas korlensis]|uniref:histidine kinase n=1 Tax=Halomonas korlensis TaxID=463301 RepID=A0A1I7F8W3_9GAMM|nr:sensor histidine kinase [Halomonas korlensis]SFU32617.1 two-component system, OmpR family, sensor histidine kinase TctE [Halomonas korlensis]
MTLTDSLYRRLLTWLLVPLLALGGLMLLLAWSEARRTADRAFDRLLEAATLSIAEQVQWQDEQLWLDLPPAALEMLATDAQERVFYSLVDQAGRVVTGNAELPGDPRDDSASGDTRLYRDIEWRGMELRQGVRRSRLEDWRLRERFEVRVAHTREGREALMKELLRGNLAYILAMAAVAITVLLLAIRAALTPLTRLRRAIRARDPRTLEPLTLPLPRELAELRETLNDLLARMRRVRANQERFIGDASHQLRTPLAGLSARAELALRQEDPARWREALLAMQTTSAKTARLAMQLLSLTRLDNPEYQPELVPLDLNAIAREAVREHWSQCQRSGVDLGLEASSSPLVVNGVDWQFAEALSNLIDNAQRYGARCITVRTRATPLTLEVEDDGPGIPAELRLRMLRPFHRGDEALEGSGLGLAIVDGIARSHHATLNLEAGQDGRGLRVRLVFPEAAQ